MNDQQPSRDQTNAKQPQEAVRQKKGKPIRLMTKYELTRLRQKLWREHPEKMENIRKHATLCAKRTFDLKDENFRNFIIQNIPAKATREQIIEIVEGQTGFLRTFKNPESRKHKDARANGKEVKLTFNSFIVRAKRRGYLTFEVNEFVWMNNLVRAIAP